MKTRLWKLLLITDTNTSTHVSEDIGARKHLLRPLVAETRSQMSYFHYYN